MEYKTQEIYNTGLEYMIPFDLPSTEQQTEGHLEYLIDGDLVMPYVVFDECQTSRKKRDRSLHESDKWVQKNLRKSVENTPGVVKIGAKVIKGILSFPSW